MSMSQEDTQDVLRVLAICFREGASLDALDLERVMSFDMEWLSPEEAESSVQALIKAGWLSGSQEALTPTVSLQGITSPLGWFPRPSRLLQPSNPITSEEPKRDKESRSTPLPNAPTGEANAKAKPAQVNDDPRSKLTPRLTKFIARQSQLAVEEVERRAERKAKALTYASHWVCLALVAREQGLAMEDITAALSVY